MTKYDLVNNLGSIAKFDNATRDFKHTPYSDASMIGQFGVGFYSAYLVADKVTVVSKHNHDNQYLWESDGRDSFTIRTDHGKPLERGTKIVLHIKEDYTEFLQQETITAIINKHSKFIHYPIKLIAENIHIKEVSDDEADDDVKKNENECMKYENKNEKKKKIIQEKCLIEHIFNAPEPFWTRNPDDISQDEYCRFYKTLTYEWETYLAMKHFFVTDEEYLDLKVMLFIPRRMSLHQHETKKHNKAIRLYVRSVFIMDNCEELLPDYLSFIKCVVDTKQFPLGVSNDMLQHDDVFKLIRNILVNKSLELLEELAQNKGKYNIFYREFSSNLKMGVHKDSYNRTKLSDLLRFHTSASGDEVCSLKDYVSRMKPKQTKIYYISGENHRQLAHSVFIERILSCGYEVIFMSDPVDEYVLDKMIKYDGKELVSASKEGLDIPETDKEKEKHEKDKSRFDSLCKVMKDILGNKIEKVFVGNQLVQSPSCIVTSQNGWTANLERLVKAHKANYSFTMDPVSSTKFMEINPDHRIINALRKKVEVNPNDMALRDLVMLLFETSMLISGFTLDYPKFHATRIHKMIELGMGINEDFLDDENEFLVLRTNFEKSLNMEEVD